MTLFSLADQCGIHHNEARRIAGSVKPILRHYHKLDRLSRFEESQLRPLFLRAKRAAHPTMPFAAIPRPAEEKPMNDKPEGMTIREIAAACDVDETTVCRWIDKASCKMPEASCKMQEASETKKPAHFTLPEVLAILRAGGKGPLADVLTANAEMKAEAKSPKAPAKSARLPAGIQLHELRLIYGPQEAGRRLDQLLGYSPARPPAALSEPTASEAEAAAMFAGILDSISGKGARQIAAVAQAVIRREAAALEPDAAQGRLGL